MIREMMSTKEVAEYLNLNEKKVYALIKEGGIPCTRVTGKWVFPRRLIDRWIVDDAMRKADVASETDNVILTGSHDLSIDLLASEVNGRHSPLMLLTANVGSLGGLSALSQGRCHMAGSHLLHPDTNEYNVPYLSTHLPHLEAVVVSFVEREQGLMVQPGNPLKVEGFEDLIRSGLRFVNRQEGSGTRLLLDQHLKRLGLDPKQVVGCGVEVCTHTEVAAAVRGQRADTGLGVHAAALAFGLDFIPIARERFDLIIPKPLFYTEPVQKVLEVARSEAFARRTEQLGGYGVENAGTVLEWA